MPVQKKMRPGREEPKNKNDPNKKRTNSPGGISVIHPALDMDGYSRALVSSCFKKSCITFTGVFSGVLG